MAAAASHHPGEASHHLAGASHQPEASHRGGGQPMPPLYCPAVTVATCVAPAMLPLVDMPPMVVPLMLPPT